MDTRHSFAQPFVHNDAIPCGQSPSAWFALTMASPDGASPIYRTLGSDLEEDACSMCSDSSDGWNCEHLVPVVNLAATRRTPMTDSAPRRRHASQHAGERDSMSHSAMISDVVHRSLALTSHISITAAGPLANTTGTHTRHFNTDSNITSVAEYCHHSCPAHLGAFWQPSNPEYELLRDNTDRLVLDNRTCAAQHMGGFLLPSAPQNPPHSRQRHVIQNWLSTLSPQHYSPIPVPEVTPVGTAVTTALADHGQQDRRSMSSRATAATTSTDR